MLFTILLPAHNEELRIRESIKTIAKYYENINYNVEILVIENGSKDATEKTAAAAALDYLHNRHLYYKCMRSAPGKGAAVRLGLEVARGKYILVTDVDLSTPIWEINKLYNMMIDSNSDIAIGSRRLPGSFVLGLTLARRLTSWAFSAITRTVIPGIKDTQCGFKLFTQAAARELSAIQCIDGFAYDVETLLNAELLGLKIIEVPVTWVNDKNSTVRVIKDSFNMAADVARLKGRRRFYEKN